MNPFKFGTIVQGEFFTDRIEELEHVKQGYVIKSTTYELEDPFFCEWVLHGNNGE